MSGYDLYRIARAWRTLDRPQKGQRAPLPEARSGDPMHRDPGMEYATTAASRFKRLTRLAERWKASKARVSGSKESVKTRLPPEKSTCI
jgi:hypothetical protein